MCLLLQCLLQSGSCVYIAAVLVPITKRLVCLFTTSVSIAKRLVCVYCCSTNYKAVRVRVYCCSIKYLLQSGSSLCLLLQYLLQSSSCVLFITAVPITKQFVCLFIDTVPATQAQTDYHFLQEAVPRVFTHSHQMGTLGSLALRSEYMKRYNASRSKLQKLPYTSAKHKHQLAYKTMSWPVQTKVVCAAFRVLHFEDHRFKNEDFIFPFYF